MHGRKRSTREEHDPPEVKAVKAEKYKQYLQGCKLALSSEVAASKAEKLLRYNPDFFTLWNARRRFLLHELQESTDDPVESRRKLLDNELALTKEQISERNSKSYGAWYHRRWSIETFGRYGDLIVCDLQGELALCDLLLTRDERNFHCWAHRRFVAELAQLPNEDALNKSTALIEKNFSNYSAWHLRVQALSKIDEYHDWSKEFDLVHQAIFTEPADQSAWLYFRWLLAKDDVVVTKERIHEEIEVIQSLIEEEGDCKWPLLALLQLYSKMEMTVETRELAQDVCRRIEVVDRGHVEFYKFVQALFHEGDLVKLGKTLFCSRPANSRDSV